MASPDADTLSKLVVIAAQEAEDWKQVRTDWTTSKRAATKELSKQMVTMKFHNYDTDTAGFEAQNQVISQLDNAIIVLNARKESFDRSLWAVADFKEKIIGQNNDEDERINTFTTQTM